MTKASGSCSSPFPVDQSPLTNSGVFIVIAIIVAIAIVVAVVVVGGRDNMLMLVFGVMAMESGLGPSPWRCKWPEEAGVGEQAIPVPVDEVDDSVRIRVIATEDTGC